MKSEEGKVRSERGSANQKGRAAQRAIAHWHGLLLPRRPLLGRNSGKFQKSHLRETSQMRKFKHKLCTMAEGVGNPEGLGQEPWRDPGRGRWEKNEGSHLVEKTNWGVGWKSPKLPTDVQCCSGVGGSQGVIKVLASMSTVPWFR